MKTTEKGEVRIRIPQWILDELERSAIASGITAKPIAAAAAQVLDSWAREQEEKRAVIENVISAREGRLKAQAERLTDVELAFAIDNAQRKISHFTDINPQHVSIVQTQLQIFSEEQNRRIGEDKS